MKYATEFETRFIFDNYLIGFSYIVTLMFISLPFKNKLNAVNCQLMTNGARSGIRIFDGAERLQCTNLTQIYKVDLNRCNAFIAGE